MRSILAVHFVAPIVLDTCRTFLRTGFESANGGGGATLAEFVEIRYGTLGAGTGGTLVRTRDQWRCTAAKAHNAIIVDDVKLPKSAARAVRAYATLRKKAEEEDRRAALAARRAVRVLRAGRLKMSARDAARLLGLSHQRIHQLTQSDDRR
jgi:hypothetical protein